MNRPRAPRAQPATLKATITKWVLGFVSIYIVYWLLSAAVGVSFLVKSNECMEQAPKGKPATDAESRARGEAFLACIEGRLNFVERLFYKREDMPLDANPGAAR